MYFIWIRKINCDDFISIKKIIKIRHNLKTYYTLPLWEEDELPAAAIAYGVVGGAGEMKWLLRWFKGGELLTLLSDEWLKRYTLIIVKYKNNTEFKNWIYVKS